MRQWSNESMNQWTNESAIHESKNQLTNESMKWWLNESMNQGISESMKRWINQSMKFRLSVNQWISEPEAMESSKQRPNESMNQWINAVFRPRPPKVFGSPRFLHFLGVKSSSCCSLVRISPASSFKSALRPSAFCVSCCEIELSLRARALFVDNLSRSRLAHAKTETPLRRPT